MRPCNWRQAVAGLAPALIAACTSGRGGCLAVVEVEQGADRTLSGSTIALPGGATLVTYGDALDGQPAIRDAHGRLRVLRDFIGWTWAATMSDQGRLLAVLSCRSDATANRLLMIASWDGGMSWEDRTVTAPAMGAPAAAPATAPGGSERRKEVRLQIADADGDGALRRSLAIFISEDGGEHWYLEIHPEPR